MKKKTRFLVLILALLLVLPLAGCASSKALDTTRGNSAAFVRAVARAVTFRTDDPSLFYDGGDSLAYDLDAEPVLQPYFAMLRFRARQDRSDPELVHYSCRIPGAVTSCFNMAYNVCFDKITKYSKWVKVSGDLRVITDEQGRRQIDISGGDNAFAVYAALRYINPLFFTVNGIDVSDGIAKEDFSDGLNLLLNRSCDAYAALLGQDAKEYAESTVVPELEAVQNHTLRVMLKSNHHGYGFRNWFRSLNLVTKVFVIGLAGFGVISIFGELFVILAEGVQIAFENLLWDMQRNREAKPKDLYSGRVKTPALLERIVKKSGLKLYDGKFHIFCKMQGEHGRAVSYGSMEALETAERLAVALAVKPYEDVLAVEKKKSYTTEDVLRFLCKTIHAGLRADQFTGADEGSTEEFRRHLVTAAGWAAAAAGRILAKKMGPEDIAGNLEHMSAAVERYNAELKKVQEAYRERDALKKASGGAAKASFLDFRNEEIQKQINDLEDTLERGLGGYMLDNGDLPLAYLMRVLSDSQSRAPRFIRQGVIMGLVDWLSEHRDHPEAAKLLQTVVSVRADMIRSDRDLSFFEVRVPEMTSKKDYALLLKDVLHCANPSLQFCDTEKLLSLAEKEVPGCLSMLYACPLRLIDPVNRQTLGFYQFKPYIHAMFVQYVPPLNAGQVIARYHEVDDRTKPLSSGLALSLFRDPYAVIPTIFHEYKHFRGDRNEASVFLKTQLFSIRFYQKYRDANAKADGVFAHLTSILGLPPAADKRGALNELIERMYGKQLSPQDAEKRADSEIEAINRFVDSANAQETWDPEVKLPRLSKDEDRENRDLIRDIVIRFATVPRSVTAEEFDAIVKGAAKG